MTAAEDRTIRLADVRDIPSLDKPAPAHTWRPHDLVELAANPPEPPTIGGILYHGKRAVLSGETESMKTWLALILAKAEMDIGLAVAWVDLDAMGPGAMLERLKLLGCTTQQVSELFLYYQPAEMLDGPKIDELTAAIATLQIRLLVIDAFNPFLSMHGLEPNSTPDIDTFWRTIANPICQAGAAAVLLDHVVKNSESRGKYAYGSERKASGVDGVHLGFRQLEPLTKGGRGRSLLTVHKDRPGYLPRPALGRLLLESDGDRIAYSIEPDRSHEGDQFRPTVLMEKISRYLERQTGPVSKNTVETEVTGNAKAKREAITALVDEAYAATQPGPKNSTLYTTIRPYRETDDKAPFSSSSVRPDLVLDLRSRPSSSSSPPLKGTRSGEDLGRQTVPTSSNVIHEYEWPPEQYLEQMAADAEIDELVYLEPDGPANGNEP